MEIWAWNVVPAYKLYESIGVVWKSMTISRVESETVGMLMFVPLEAAMATSTREERYRMVDVRRLGHMLPNAIRYIAEQCGFEEEMFDLVRLLCASACELEDSTNQILDSAMTYLDSLRETCADLLCSVPPYFRTGVPEGTFGVSPD